MTTAPRILVPVDFGTCSRRAIRVARALAARAGASLVLAHVMPASGLRDRDDRWWSRYAAQTLVGLIDRAKLPAGTRAVILRGHAAPEIAKYAQSQQVNLIVLCAAHGWAGAELGATASQILRTAGVPVLVVPPPAAARKGRAA